MIYVDRRIGSVDLAAPLKEMGLSIQVVSLPFADVAFHGRDEGDSRINVGVELKKLPDLCSSLRTGRLNGHQAPGLQDAYDYRWLVVEGDYAIDTHGRVCQRGQGGRIHALHGSMTLDEMEGRLLTLSLASGLHIRHTRLRWQTLRFIMRLYRWWTEASMEQHKSHLTPKQPHRLVPIGDARELLCRLPNVGPAVSQAAYMHFGSIYGAITAPAKDWAELVVNGKRLGDKAGLEIAEFVKKRSVGSVAH